MFEHFHFIQPWWLLSLLPLAWLLWQISHHGNNSNPWKKIVDARLLAFLMSQQQQTKHYFPVGLLAAAWLLTVLALANPTWEQQPQPVMQTSTSRVIVLDLSRSMLATDLKPSRITRARFKVEDILADNSEGQTGLVVFAGDAFSVTPLTRDADTIRAHLKALDPGIMPSQGSRADLGLLKAEELLQQAGVQTAQVILIADGVEGNKATLAASRLRQSGFRVSVLGVGTNVGAPLPNSRGGISKDSTGKPIMVKLDSSALQSVAQAGGGHYIQMMGNETDIHYLLGAEKTGFDKTDAEKNNNQNVQPGDLQSQKWKEQGPLLAILLLPLAALAFRRGWLLSVVLLISLTGMFAQPKPVMAFGWDDLWQRKDQQAAKALSKGDYEHAANLAEDPAQRGSAEYKKGDYQKALDAFNQIQNGDAAYNRGNALAKQNKYKEAINAYDEALKAQPGMEDAMANKSAVETQLKRQQQQQNKSDQQNESDKKNKQDQQNKSDQQNDQKQQNQSEQQSDQGQQEEQNKQAQPEQQNNQQDKQQDNSDDAFARANEQLKNKKNKQDQDEDEANPSTPPTAEKQSPEQQQAENDASKTENNPTPDQSETNKAEKLTSEEQLAAQQWLRRIPDDPGGLLRRKFLYQYQQRNQQPNTGNRQNW